MDKQLKDEAFDFTIANPEKSTCECYIAGATSSSTVKELEREVERLKKYILELNAANSGLHYAATELQFRVGKQNEHISILQDKLKEADKISAANNKKCQNIDNK